jgi:CheY-like chemotaxis protein
MLPLPCVLLVDDDHTTNFLNQSLLRRLQITERVMVALDGEAALAELQRQCVPPTPGCPVLILLDVNMPGLNGIQFLEAYQRLPLAESREIVIVMLSTSLHPRDVERIQGFNLVADFVTKPLTDAKMRSILTAHFS